MIPAQLPHRCVEVLLSTHNGERYVATQLATILNQSYPNVRVLVRDDQSSDGTVEAVRSIASRDARVRLIEGRRLGWAASFMALLAASGDARWLAFSDQDDVWLPDKLARAVTALEPLDDRPALYGSAMLHVCDRLRPLDATPRPRQVGFENALVQNVVPGCTMVLNRAARSLCLERLPSRVPTHDWWLYLVAAAFGTVIFDEAITVLHRVHGRNATPSHLWRHWPRRIAAHVRLAPHQRLSALLAEFHRTFADRLTSGQRGTLEQLLRVKSKSWPSRARYAWRAPVFRQTTIDDAILRVILTLGRF